MKQDVARQSGAPRESADEAADAGQPNGPAGMTKGQMTRARILCTASRLLGTMSPVTLSVAAIAKESGVSPAAFYQYFSDVSDLLGILCAGVTTRMCDAFEASSLFLSRAAVEADGYAFLDMLGEAWDRQGCILNYRNMEADRGDPGCSALRQEWSRHVIARLNKLILSDQTKTPPLSFEEAGAEALVVFTAMERLAAAVRREQISPEGAERIRHAQVRVLMRTFGNSR